MFDELLINDKSKSWLIGFAKKPSHALILVGQVGAGKLTIAKLLAAKLLQVTGDSVDKHPFFTHISKAQNAKNITIDEIRAIKKSLSLKAPTTTSLARRVILIEDAQYMNREAQSAFLKSLEEPAAQTFFIMTATDTSELLPTIVSRAAVIPIKSVGLAQAQDNLSQFSKNEVVSAWHLSGGNQRLLIELLTQEDHDLKSALAQAKTLLKMSRYERVVWLDSISQDKDETRSLLEALSKLLRALYKASIVKNNSVMSVKLLTNAKYVEQTIEDLKVSSNSRLSLLTLALKLKT